MAYQWKQREIDHYTDMLDVYGTRGAFFETRYFSPEWINRMLELGLIALKGEKSTSPESGDTYKFTEAGRAWAYEKNHVSAHGKQWDAGYDQPVAPVAVVEYVAPAPEYPDNVNAVMDAQTVRKSAVWVNTLLNGCFRPFEHRVSGHRGMDDYFNPFEMAEEMRDLGLLDAKNEVTAKGRWWLKQL